MRFSAKFGPRLTNSCKLGQDRAYNGNNPASFAESYSRPTWSNSGQICPRPGHLAGLGRNRAELAEIGRIWPAEAWRSLRAQEQGAVQNICLCEDLATPGARASEHLEAGVPALPRRLTNAPRHAHMDAVHAEADRCLDSKCRVSADPCARR